jgi:hypothetical protein
MTNKSKTRTKRTTKRTPETPLPANAIPRAAARAGIPGVPAKVERKMSRKETGEYIAALVGQSIVLASELLAEQIAAAQKNEDHELESDLSYINVELWKCRWELGLLPEYVRVERDKLRRIAIETSYADQTAPSHIPVTGGAS